MPPAAPAAAPTPAPIHDIADIVLFSPYPLWVWIAGGIAVAALLGLLVWWIFLRRRPAKVLTPQQRALAALILLQGESALAPYEFGIRVSDILRAFIDEAFGIRAVTATSLEFLESIRHNPRFTADERAALRDFLEQVDLLKFARVETGGEEHARLVALAEAVVRKPQPEAAAQAV